jgi:hypothetical protein
MAKSDRERLLSKIVKGVNEKNCWRWAAADNPSTSGYGNFRQGSTVVPAHRAAAKVLGGKSIAGKDLHHVCGNRWCVNPGHLRVMSHGANMAADVKRRAGGR